MKRRRKEQWRELMIGEFERAGLTQVEFARLYGVNVGTFVRDREPLTCARPGVPSAGCS